jgi:hypothetical protein
VEYPARRPGAAARRGGLTLFFVEILGVKRLKVESDVDRHGAPAF